MKKILIFALLLLTCGLANGQEVRFQKNGKLKIAQFTDTHISFDSEYRRAESEKTLSQVCYILDTERPDVVMFTGDIVTGSPAPEAWTRLLDELAKRKIPFGVTIGNHDCEQNMTREEISKLITSYPLSLNILKDDIIIDDAVEVLASQGDKIAALLYMLDSNDYPTIDGLSGYGWLTHGQVQNYRDMSLEYTKNNNNTPYPSLAFFHIPLNEYEVAAKDKRNQKFGIRGEQECPPVINTGIYASFLERGDVFGTFAGHDHNNDYIVNMYGIALGYGRFSGYKTTYTNLRAGVRIIELIEGKRAFETWIHERDGAIINHILFEDNKMNKFEKYPL